MSCPGGYSLSEMSTFQSDQVLICRCMDIPEIIQCEKDQDSVIIKASCMSAWWFNCLSRGRTFLCHTCIFKKFLIFIISINVHCSSLLFNFKNSIITSNFRTWLFIQLAIFSRSMFFAYGTYKYAYILFAHTLSINDCRLLYYMYMWFI